MTFLRPTDHIPAAVIDASLYFFILFFNNFDTSFLHIFILFFCEIQSGSTGLEVEFYNDVYFTAFVYPSASEVYGLMACSHVEHGQMDTCKVYNSILNKARLFGPV